MTEQNSTLKAAYPKMPADFTDSSTVENGLSKMRGLGKGSESSTADSDDQPAEKIEESPARRLAEDSDELSEKSKLQLAISIVKQDLLDVYNNGDMESLKLAYPKKKFLETIKKRISCLEVSKTNKKENHSHLKFVKDDKCLDFEKAKYKKMIELWDDKIKWPQVPKEYSKDTDFEDIFVDDVTSHLDEAKDNLNDKCEYSKKKAKKTLRLMRGRRLQINDMKEIPKDKNWDTANDDPLKFRTAKRGLGKGENTEGEVPAGKDADSDSGAKVVAEDKEKSQRGMSLGDVFHHEVGGKVGFMKKDSPKLSDTARPQVIRDNLVFLLDND